MISLLNKVLGTLSNEERPKMGEAIQNLRNNFETKFTEKANTIKKALKDAALSQKYIDVTLSPYSAMNTAHINFCRRLCKWEKTWTKTNI